MLTVGFLLGLGQIYNGQFKKGIIILFIEHLHVDHHPLGAGMCMLSTHAIAAAGILAMGMYDAYMTANKINDGEPVKDWLD